MKYLRKFEGNSFNILDEIKSLLIDLEDIGATTEIEELWTDPNETYNYDVGNIISRATKSQTKSWVKMYGISIRIVSETLGMLSEVTSEVSVLKDRLEDFGIIKWDLYSEPYGDHEGEPRKAIDFKLVLITKESSSRDIKNEIVQLISKYCGDNKYRINEVYFKMVGILPFDSHIKLYGPEYKSKGPKRKKIMDDIVEDLRKILSDYEIEYEIINLYEIYIKF